MARPLRIEYPGALYHITSRGNAQQSIFNDQMDRRSFLELLETVVNKFNWLCHAYCLMGNHYHLCIETPEGNLSQGMRQLNGVYTQKFNKRHDRGGHIFQGRFHAVIIDKDNYFQEVCRYIVLNAVRAGMVGTPDEYPWSSYMATAGKLPSPGFLSTNQVLSQFGRFKAQAQHNYRIFVMEGIGKAGPFDLLKGQIFLGDETFIARFKFSLKDAKEIQEIPIEQRTADRPELKVLFRKVDDMSKPERDQLIRLAHEKYLYSQADIGKYLGIHYTRISRIVNGRGSGLAF